MADFLICAWQDSMAMEPVSQVSAFLAPPQWGTEFQVDN